MIGSEYSYDVLSKTPVINMEPVVVTKDTVGRSFRKIAGKKKHWKRKWWQRGMAAPALWKIYDTSLNITIQGKELTYEANTIRRFISWPCCLCW